MNNNEINLVFSENTDLREDEVYIVNCEEYHDAKLYLSTDSFDRSIIKGYIKNLNTKLSTSSINYTEVTFVNCTFKEKSWMDLLLFDRCKFIDCNFHGRCRDVTFDKCSFENTHFSMSYMRWTTLKKNCLFNNVTIETKKIDDYVWCSGKRYPEFASHHYVNILKAT